MQLNHVVVLSQMTKKQFCESLVAFSYLSSNNAKPFPISDSQVCGFAAILCFIWLYIEYLWVWDCLLEQNKLFAFVTLGSGNFYLFID